MANVLPLKDMTKFTLAYELHEHGWATATLCNDDVSVDMTVSYLHDTLRELANAAYHVSRGTADRMVVFMDEPGEHQLKIMRLDDSNCSYSIDWYDDWHSWGMKSVGDGYPKRITEGVVSARRFMQQVHTVLWTLFDTFGIDGYKSRWCEHDFPEAEMKRLSGVYRD
ncbi:hypothetical protein [Rhodopirellula halodulae]|uniref:hypothetical protein n=1 Tax=Rhodopirellula halodulae TaxID=2894198 RepID=UPI001E5C6CAB|nr:hypothetical protein [Rhodopirellula sp. JC737]MCC9658794.1 hypothetical protein [Rhodopirellula sp. JC737]